MNPSGSMYRVCHSSRDSPEGIAVRPAHIHAQPRAKVLSNIKKGLGCATFKCMVSKSFGV